MGESADKVMEFKKNLLKERLSMCTKKQQEFFYRVFNTAGYHTGRVFGDGKSQYDLDEALAIVNRTIANNRNKEKGDI